MRMLRRIDLIVVALAIGLAFGCGGGGCGGCAGMEPIPGGFDPSKRTPNAVQVRVTQTGLAAITADPAALIGGLAGGGGGTPGVIEFSAPASCGGSTPICCPNGQPVSPCGPIKIDLNQQPGDQPRMELRPAQGASRLDVTVRARIKTGMDIPVTVPIAGNCGVKIDTTAGSIKDIKIDVPVAFQQDAQAGTTKVVVGEVVLSNLQNEDVSLTGGFGCQIANLGLSFFLSTLTSQITDAVKGAVQDATCKTCESGNVSDCGSFATACTDQVCMKGNECLQELGLSGRARGNALFASLSPGTTGALDIYEVAGGYATSNTNGLALGLLGGMQPGGVARDRCGPPGRAPGAVSIPQSTFFQGNTRPDTGQAFGIGIGVHKSQLDEFAYAGYDGGLLCLTLSHNTVSQLSTDTLALLSRSLGKLVETNSPMAVGLRPQSAPVITLGRNTFVDDGMGGKMLEEPLLDIKFTGMEIDFYAAIDDQYIRTFTVVSDVHLPVGLQPTAMGEIAPVIGNPQDAFTNIAVKNSEAITEAPADLAALFPNLLGLVLPQLSNGIAPIALPSLGGLNLQVTDITAVDDVSFLAIFANLAPAMKPQPVQTVVALHNVTEPPVDVARSPVKWKGAQGPMIDLDLGGTNDRGPLEWSIKLNDGTWSAWSANPHRTITHPSFWLPGDHKIEVRARVVGKPETIDPTPAVLTVRLGEAAFADTRRASPLGGRPFHGQPGEGGCDCQAGGDPAAAAPLALVVAMTLLPLARRARRRRPIAWKRLVAGMARVVRPFAKLGAVVWFAALASLPGCSCGSAPCGDQACLEGDIPHGGLGRYTSIAADGTRVVVATYDQNLGDLVVAEATDPANLKLTVVDGVPDGVTPTHDPGSYRGGVEEPGPNVGAWTSIALSGGLARVAYQDRETRALKFAYELKVGTWASYIVDGSKNGEEVGRYASIAIDAEGRPAIAYIALGVPDGAGHRVTELRLARAGTAAPGEFDWATSAIASANGTCAGLCGAGKACVAGLEGESCISPSSDCGGGCGTGQVCNAAACVAELVDPKVATLATGTGLFASLVLLPDGRLAVAYYDASKRGLFIAVENAQNGNAFTSMQLDGDPMGLAGDTGLWASAVADTSGVVHVAYQDAIGDQLKYTTWNGAPGIPEVVDDGQRAGDRPHSVGASAAIILVNGAPNIAYQDGTSADVYVAQKSGAAWTTSGLAMGPLLDGLSIGAATSNGAPFFAWGRIDPAADILNQLAVSRR
ncbi:MAG: hypothetical protein KF773_25810 [Deltaproteobacteria bacterium]|nr:hypothetical protein [Deltaproteobacteria bacterium]